MALMAGSITHKNPAKHLKLYQAMTKAHAFQKPVTVDRRQVPGTPQRVGVTKTP